MAASMATIAASSGPEAPTAAAVASGSAADRGWQVRLWASRRGQTLARTVAGVMDYASSYQALLQAEITVRAIMDEVAAGKLCSQSSRQAAVAEPLVGGAAETAPPVAGAAGALRAVVAEAASLGTAVRHTDGMDGDSRPHTHHDDHRRAGPSSAVAAVGDPRSPLAPLPCIAESAGAVADWLTYLKCSHVCCSQAQGSAGVQRQQDRADTDRLLAAHPLLSVVHIDEPRLPGGPDQQRNNAATCADDTRAMRYRGNHTSSMSLRQAALPLLRGLYVQQLDAAQDAYAFEAFKLPNFLSEFEPPGPAAMTQSWSPLGATTGLTDSGCSQPGTGIGDASDATAPSRCTKAATRRCRDTVALVGMREHCFTQELSTK